MRTVYQRIIGRNAIRRIVGLRQLVGASGATAANRFRRRPRPGVAISDAVAEAMARVPRESFAPETQREIASEDRALPIGCGQTMSQPTLVAQMVSLLGLPADGNAKVLDVGSGSGYTSAILSQLARRVIAVERIPELAEQSRTRLTRLGCDNVEVLDAADDALGCTGHAPYDGILVSAAAPKVPQSLVGQLSAGSTMVVPVGTRTHQRLAVVTKDAIGDGHQMRYSSECRFVPLIGPEGWSEEHREDDDELGSLAI